MGKLEQLELQEKAAIAAFGALMQNTAGRTNTEIAVEAWQAAEVFVKAKETVKMERYFSVLRKYQNRDALHKVLELDGYQNRGLEYEMSRYEGKPDPLLAYAESNIGPETTGQKAIKLFLEQQRGTAA